MKKSKKKIIRKELIGKSREYQDGYEEAEGYFEHIVKGGRRFGSAVFRIYVEAVAEWIRDKRPMSDERVKLIDYVTLWNDSEFNHGVRDLLVRRANNYRGLRLIDVWVKKEDDLQVKNIPQ